ncbi:serine/threonine-protein kinase [Hyalangium versicolor]|uniref:serine/threonine-protein kinase n=1 Tax=Hyalangium versicolor TaxID=2861190 RepID=UPI002815E28D|nr:serine/threonine-protein kinase [Hyalangium versicolor]
MSLEMGEQFGRYALVSQLNRGGMAETWRAQLMAEAGVTKPVLIKKVLPEFATDEAFIAMFISEARISATLSHGNIAQVYDFGRVGGDYFLAMEYVDGQPLHRITKRARRSGYSTLPIPIATFIALEMCRGLHYAHTRQDASGQPLGIVHRDISPDNVLVSYEGQVKIVDFGIAKARQLRGFDTEPGIVKGKYLYFSPEQARGEQVDARTDVWATGIVLYDMLCGRMPVTDAPYVAVPKLTQGEFPRPAVLNPALPPELDAIVMRALAVNRDERYESSNAFGDALAEFLYSTTPRFSAMSLSHFIQELFREDLISTGHQVQVPPSFQEQMAQWRGEIPSNPSSPPLTPTPSSGISTAPSVPSLEAPARKGLSGGVVIGSMILGALLAVVFLKVTQPTEVTDPTQPQPIAVRAEPPPPPVRPSSPPVAEPAPPADTPEPAAPQEPDSPHVRASASYPVNAIRLDARKDIINIRDVAEKLLIEPGATYRISEPKPPQDSPPLFFWLSGAQLRAKDGVGTLSPRPLQIKGATELKVFLLGPPPAGARPRGVLVENIQTKARQQLAVRPGSTADLERAFELKNLDPASTYELTLALVENGPLTRGAAGGELERLGCVRFPIPEGDSGAGNPRPSQRDQQFLLTTQASVNLSNASSLLCGFIDDDPTDNQGEAQIRIERAGRGAEWTHPSPYALAMPEKIAEVKSAFDQALRLFLEQQYDRAAIFAERCISLEPQDADCHLLAGATYASIPGHREKAASHYRSFLSLASNHSLAASVRRDLMKLQQSGGP